MIEYARCIYINWIKQYSTLTLAEQTLKQPEFLKLASTLLNYSEQELSDRLNKCHWYFK